jgi:ribosomal protein S18 acetylase RimI-like enzyme
MGETSRVLFATMDVSSPVSPGSHGGYARVDLLWVDEAMRRRGLGRALLTAAEDEARRRDCTTIVLDTHSFQAPGFYSGLGYAKVGETIDTPVGFTSATFQKRL